jgi:hypothetical protein
MHLEWHISNRVCEIPPDHDLIAVSLALVQLLHVGGDALNVEKLARDVPEGDVGYGHITTSVSSI